jgi:branched-chain amino acid transport system permease protein
VGAFILILLPEYLRFLSEYRILAFGAILVLMMVFRPGGIVEVTRRTYEYKEPDQSMGQEKALT